MTSASLLVRGTARDTLADLHHRARLGGRAGWWARATPLARTPDASRGGVAPAQAGGGVLPPGVPEPVGDTVRYAPGRGPGSVAPVAADHGPDTARDSLPAHTLAARTPAG
ncbi:hypothetical protein ACWF94_32040 [Streptomyces sp. NPDC055078]